MSDMERRLRELSSRTLDEVPGLSPNHKVLGRIKRRRATIVFTVALSIVVAVAGGVYASSSLFGDGRTGPVPPSRDTVERCATLEFEPTYLPPGFSDEPSQLRSSEGGELQPGHEVARYHGLTRGAFIGVYLAPIPGIARVDREQLTVLGAPAELAGIHEGFLLSFSSRGCHYEAHAYGVKRAELRWFGLGLSSAPNTMRFTPIESPSTSEPFTGAIWPEDTVEAADSACSTYQDWRGDRMSVALEFAREVLGWSEPAAFELQLGAEGDVEVRRSGGHDGEGLRGVVRISTTEVRPGCWSVAGVGRPPDRRPTGVSVSVQGRRVEVGFARLGAAYIRVEVAYGGRSETVQNSGEPNPVGFDLEFDPDTTGHYLILLMTDGECCVFSATGGPLPPGDFSAG